MTEVFNLRLRYFSRFSPGVGEVRDTVKRSNLRVMKSLTTSLNGLINGGKSRRVDVKHQIRSRVSYQRLLGSNGCRTLD